MIAPTPPSFHGTISTLSAVQCGHVTTAAVRIPRFRVLGAQQPSAGQTLKSTSHLLPPGVPCGGESPAVRPRRGEKHAEFLVVVEVREPQGTPTRYPSRPSLMPCSSSDVPLVHFPSFQSSFTSLLASAKLEIYDLLIGSPFLQLGAYTFGVWRRFSEFKELSEQIIGSGSDSEGGGGGGGGSEWGHFPNAAFSWQCIRMRKRWYDSLLMRAHAHTSSPIINLSPLLSPSCCPVIVY